MRTTRRRCDPSSSLQITNPRPSAVALWLETRAGLQAASQLLPYASDAAVILLVQWLPLAVDKRKWRYSESDLAVFIWLPSALEDPKLLRSIFIICSLEVVIDRAGLALISNVDDAVPCRFPLKLRLAHVCRVEMAMVKAPLLNSPRPIVMERQPYSDVHVVASTQV